MNKRQHQQLQKHKDKKMHTIFGLIDPRTKRVFHVGCAADLENRREALPEAVALKVAEIAPDVPHIVVLQSVERRPLAEWVKWCKRFRRDVVTRDWEMHTALVDAFTNSNRLKRALGYDVPSDAEYQRKFHEFDRENPEVFEEMLRLARRLKAEGRLIYGIDSITTDMRWAEADTNRTDGFKINDSHRAFYARKLQMVDPTLCGFFSLRESCADELVLNDGRTWRDFAKQHSDELRFAEVSEEDNEDTAWEY